MGHAGAIISAFGESAAEKVEILKASGVTVAPTPYHIGSTMAEVLKQGGLMARLLVAAAFAAAAAAAEAQPSAADLAADFHVLAADPAALSDVLLAWFDAIPPQHLSLYHDYLIKLLNEPLLAAYLAEHNPPRAGESTADFFSRISLDLTAGVLAHGFRRLPTEMQLQYVELTGDAIVWIRDRSPADCPVLLTARTPMIRR